MLKIAILTLFTIAHPVHVSLMSVEYAEKSDVFNVFIKLYSDDFLLDYRLLSGDTTKIDFGEINERTELLVLKYLGARIQIFANGNKLEGKLTKLYSSEGELKMEMVFNNKKRSGSYLVKNFIMTDLYLDQANLLIFRYGEYEEGVKLTPEKQEYLFKVN